jgi:hypothetical protein
MNIKIQVQKNDVGSITQLINLMFQINIEFIDYISFYNLSSILKKFQQINFSMNFKTKSKYSILLNPNEAKEFLNLITTNSNLIQQNTYFTAQMLDLKNQIHKQLSTLESQKNNLANNLILTIPKTLNR